MDEEHVAPKPSPAPGEKPAPKPSLANPAQGAPTPSLATAGAAAPAAAPSPWPQAQTPATGGSAPAPGYAPGAPGVPPTAAYPGYAPPYPYAVPYPGPYAAAFAPPPAFPPPPANRAWPAQSAVGRMRMAALLGMAAFAAEVLLHVLEAATGASQVPGAEAFAARSASSAAFILRAGELILLGSSMAVGAAALEPLRESGKMIGAPERDAVRRGAGMLCAAMALAAFGTVGSWLYFGSAQQALPGMGVGSDPGLSRLFSEYRLALAASAAAGTVAAFVFVAGVERVWGQLLARSGRASFAHFARTFTLAAAANMGVVIILYFGVLTPATLDSPPSGAWAQGLLAAGPAVAAASLFFFRRTLGEIEGRAKKLAKRAPAPKN